MIVHVCGAEALEQIEWGREKGLTIYAETCPQYLVLTGEHLKGLNMDHSGAKSSHQAQTSFRGVPNGIPRLAARMPILSSEGVGKGRINLQRFVALTSTNHAKLFGMYPTKGTIAVGADADIVLWDPCRQVTIT
jgi:dihydropyrimidinase